MGKRFNRGSEKDLNILNSTQSNLKDKISRYKSKIEYDEKQIVVLLDKALDSLKARGVRIDREQLESLIESAEGENLAAILSAADCVWPSVKALGVSARRIKPDTGTL